MAYKDVNQMDRADGEAQTETIQTLHINGDTLDLPHDSYVRDADISRDGADLVLNSDHGTIVVENYFSGIESPILISPSGASLSPQLVNSFATSGNEYAQSTSMNDASPVGAVQEISGNATITRGDGTTEDLSLGSPVYQGDIIETNAGAAVNVAFTDESNFAVSEDTRLAIDEYVFDPSSEGSVQNFSVLKGVFVYTSGLIGRDDPDDVSIDTPVGSIGIRGTIIAGDVNEGEITVVEGAIVLRDLSGGEMTLASQFETGRFTSTNGIQNLGQKSATDVVEKFSIVSNVAPNMFSSINDAATENAPAAADTQTNTEQPTQQTAPEANKETNEETQFDADGATDQDGDNKVDGTVEDAGGSDGAALDGADANTAQETAQDTNPTAVQIAQALGMSNGDNAVNMTGNKGMGGMANMAMATKHAVMNGKAMMENIIEAKSHMDIVDQIKGKAGYLENSDSAINPNLLDRIIAKSGASPTSDKDQNYVKEYFQAGELTQWSYDFGDDFQGETFLRLSQNTIDTLNRYDAYGGTGNGGLDDLLHHWSFGGARTGVASGDAQLILNFDEDFSTAPLGEDITPGSFGSFTIEIEAVNANGSVISSYNFDMFNNSIGASPSSAWGTPGTDISGTDEIFNSPVGIDSSLLTIGANSTTDNITVFMGDGVDRIEIGSGNPVTNSTINLGSGQNTATLNGGGTSLGNTIVGGNNRDTFTINNADNKMYGMDGDDKFAINQTSFSTITNNTVIDGGQSGFNAYKTLNPLSNTNQGIGDTLLLNSAGSFNFSAITNGQIKNIERIELGAGNQTIKLTLDSVMEMTDGRNTLLISGDNNDTFDTSALDGQGFNLEYTNKAIDEGSGTQNFKVYSNAEGVTLIIDSDINGAASLVA
ncbi:MAG: FecR domain-containing protein [Alphaproteobacteria bacterium]|nr:FecR domain-containing protein [Alphaproteobacteria bacterium]